MSKKIIIANWKMNPDTVSRAQAIASGIKKIKSINSEIIVCPPFVYFESIAKIFKKSKIKLGAQNIFSEKEGAYTGEVSPVMLKNFGVKYAIIGHSERRKMGEGDELVNKKIKIALKYSLTPILCIGELDRDHETNYLNFIKDQILGAFSGVAKSAVSKIILAYEPVWAIGKNAVRQATPEESMEMSIFIKKVLSDMYGSGVVKNIRIIYGGSVNPKNASDFLKHGGVDGLLVGRDSLDPKKFYEIVTAH